MLYCWPRHLNLYFYLTHTKMCRFFGRILSINLYWSAVQIRCTTAKIFEKYHTKKPRFQTSKRLLGDQAGKDWFRSQTTKPPFPVTVTLGYAGPVALTHDYCSPLLSVAVESLAFAASRSDWVSLDVCAIDEIYFQHSLYYTAFPMLQNSSFVIKPLDDKAQ